MSTLVEVRAAWNNVLSDSTVTDYTERVYNYDIINTEGVSEGHEAQFMDDGYINFVQFVTTVDREFVSTNEVQEIFTVSITYYRGIDIDGDNSKSASEFFDDLFNVVRSELGTSWDSTIDFYTMESVSRLTQVIDNKNTWVATQNYVGIKNKSL